METELRIRLTPNEYENAKALTRLTGEEPTDGGIINAVKQLLAQNVFTVATSVGNVRLYAGAYKANDGGDVPFAGLSLEPQNGGGEIIDVASIVNENDKLTVSVFGDVAREDYTDQFEITKSRLKEVFEKREA